MMEKHMELMQQLSACLLPLVDSTGRIEFAELAKLVRKLAPDLPAGDVLQLFADSGACNVDYGAFETWLRSSKDGRKCETGAGDGGDSEDLVDNDTISELVSQARSRSRGGPQPSSMRKRSSATDSRRMSRRLSKALGRSSQLRLSVSLDPDSLSGNAMSSLGKGCKLQFVVCLGEELGAGTSGKVCELEQDKALAQGSYAAKLIVCKGEQERRLRFSEARLHALLGGHTSLVRYCYSWFDSAAETLCVLMERCQNELWSHMFPMETEMGVALTQLQKLRWSVQLAEGLHHIHMHNVIHRDLNPWNVFTKLSCDSHVDVINLKIGDFGLSVLIKPSIQLPLEGVDPPDEDFMPLDESAMGSLFSAPELGHTYGFSADVYSLGMTLFFIWDSPRPVDGLIARIEDIKNNGLVPKDLQAPEMVRSLLQCMLTHDPSQRNTTDEVLRILQCLEQELLQGEGQASSRTCIEPPKKERTDHAELDQLKAYFQSNKVGGDGGISKDNLKLLFRTWADEDINVMWACMDKRNEGFVSHEGFIDWLDGK